MRWFIGILVVANLGILLWGWLGEEQQPKVELASPGVGTIRIVGEAPPVPEASAVPIPAPPRGGDAMTAPAAPPAVTEVRPREPVEAEEPLAVTPAPTVAPPADEPSPSITEPEAAPPAITAPEPAFVPEPEPLLAPPPMHCSRIGPFADEAASAATRSYLASQGEVSVEQETSREVTGYWVLVPPQPSRAAAKALADRLKAKGVTDLWVIGKGEQQFGISLGVFSQRPNADRVAKRVRDKGFEVTITEKAQERVVFWLAYQGTAAITAKDLPGGLPSGASVASEDCP